MIAMRRESNIHLNVLNYAHIENLLKTRRRRHGFEGIYDECCRNKGCTSSELRAYCLE